MPQGGFAIYTKSNLGSDYSVCDLYTNSKLLENAEFGTVSAQRIHSIGGDSASAFIASPCFQTDVAHRESLCLDMWKQSVLTRGVEATLTDLSGDLSFSACATSLIPIISKDKDAARACTQAGMPCAPIPSDAERPWTYRCRNDAGNWTCEIPDKIPWNCTEDTDCYPTLPYQSYFHCITPGGVPNQPICQHYGSSVESSDSEKLA